MNELEQTQKLIESHYDKTHTRRPVTRTVYTNTSQGYPMKRIYKLWEAEMSPGLPDVHLFNVTSVDYYDGKTGGWHNHGTALAKTPTPQEAMGRNPKEVIFERAILAANHPFFVTHPNAEYEAVIPERAPSQDSASSLVEAPKGVQESPLKNKTLAGFARDIVVKMDEKRVEARLIDQVQACATHLLEPDGIRLCPLCQREYLYCRMSAVHTHTTTCDFAPLRDALHALTTHLAADSNQHSSSSEAPKGEEASPGIQEVKIHKTQSVGNMADMLEWAVRHVSHAPVAHYDDKPEQPDISKEDLMAQYNELKAAEAEKESKRDAAIAAAERVSLRLKTFPCELCHSDGGNQNYMAHDDDCSVGDLHRTLEALKEGKVGEGDAQNKKGYKVYCSWLSEGSVEMLAESKTHAEYLAEQMVYQGLVREGDCTRGDFIATKVHDENECTGIDVERLRRLDDEGDGCTAGVHRQ